VVYAFVPPLEFSDFESFLTDTLFFLTEALLITVQIVLLLLPNRIEICWFCRPFVFRKKAVDSSGLKPNFFPSDKIDNGKNALL